MNRLRTAAVLLIAAMPATLTPQVTPQDVAAVSWKVTTMRSYFSAVWQDFFLNVQPRLYLSPKIVAYTRSIKSACGDVGSDNAAFCSHDNTIYYDQEFLAGKMKAAAASLHTDGDYAPVVILAHEWGHAAAYAFSQKDKRFSWETFAGEQLADCLAGAVTQSAERAGKLARGDVQEAEFTLQSDGEVDVSKFLSVTPNRPKTIGDRLDDDFRKFRSHGSPGDRLRAFRKGYGGTTQACVAELKLGGY